MRTPDGHNNQNRDPDQVTYNIEPSIKQLCRDLDRVVSLQKESLKLLDRIQATGEKLFSHEVFPKAKKILTIEQSFSANCYSLITCSQYLRTQASLSQVILHNLVSLSTGQDHYLKKREVRS